MCEDRSLLQLQELLWGSIDKVDDILSCLKKTVSGKDQFFQALDKALDELCDDIGLAFDFVQFKLDKGNSTPQKMEETVEE